MVLVQQQFRLLQYKSSYNREFNRIAFDYQTRKRYSVAITINYNYKYPNFISSTDYHILGATTADTLQAALAGLSAAAAATQREQTATEHTTPTLYTKKWNPQTNKKKTKQGKEMEPTRRSKEGSGLKMYKPSIEASFLLTAFMDMIIV
jgi:hypothetical protein